MNTFKLERVAVVKDESSHWYVIPIELEDLFYDLGSDDATEDEFDTEFRKYRTGGSPNRVALYARILRQEGDMPTQPSYVKYGNRTIYSRRKEKE